MEADGISLAVAEVSARYHRPARYDEEVVVATRLAGFPSRGMSFTYEVRRAAEGGELLATGSSNHISVDSQPGNVRRIPDAMRARVMAGIGQACGELPAG